MPASRRLAAWSEALALDLHERGHVVSVVNPHRIREQLGQSEGLRTKTDAVDAALIARFCETIVRRRGNRPSPPYGHCRRWCVVVRASLRCVPKNSIERKARRSTRRWQVRWKRTLACLNGQIAAIDEQIDRIIDDEPRMRGHRELLESIPGIARRTATTILGEIPDLAEFRNVKAVAAQAGLSQASAVGHEPGSQSTEQGW